MSEPIDHFQFVMNQRRKFMKEMAALTGLAMVSSAELVRGAPVSITGDDETKDMNWGSIKGRLTYDGDKIPERKEVDLDKYNLSPRDLKWFRSLGHPILEEDWVVDKKDKAIQWVYVWLLPENALVDGKKNKDAKLEIHKDLKAIPNDKKIVHVDQKEQGYVPHAVAMREGMHLNMRNKGPVPHVFQFTGLFENEDFTKAMPPEKEILIKGLKPDRSANQISCPPHPWEKMYLRVFNHPYYAVTDKHGRFEIKNAPAGKCRIVVWQESLGFKGKGRLRKYGQVIEIEGGAMKDLGDIKIKAKIEDGTDKKDVKAKAKS